MTGDGVGAHGTLPRAERAPPRMALTGEPEGAEPGLPARGALRGQG
jgi:hypothetical protein